MRDNGLGFTPKQMEELTKAIRKRLDSLVLFPHQRLNLPPMAKGRDVAVTRFMTEQTLTEHRKRGMN